MRYRKVYTPTDYITITPEMVKRWMAMEARLEDAEKFIEAMELTGVWDVKEFAKTWIRYIKDGNE